MLTLPFYSHLYDTHVPFYISITLSYNILTHHGTLYFIGYSTFPLSIDNVNHTSFQCYFEIERLIKKCAVFYRIYIVSVAMLSIYSSRKATLLIFLKSYYDHVCVHFLAYSSHVSVLFLSDYKYW